MSSDNNYPTKADCVAKFHVPAVSFQYTVIDTVGIGSSLIFNDYNRAIQYASRLIKIHADRLADEDGVEPLTQDEIIHASTGLRISNFARAGGFVFDCLAYPGGPRCMVLELPV